MFFVFVWAAADTDQPLQRLLFALIFVACMWIAWITLRGAVRAHRQRLVWGERLMS